MRWIFEFYNERRQSLAQYPIDAPSPVTAVQSAWSALRAEHRGGPRRGRPSLFERAQRAGGQDDSGWTLHRIAVDKTGP
jgi:hypothetical protein